MNWLIDPTFLSNLPMWIWIVGVILIVEVLFFILLKTDKRETRQPLWEYVILGKLMSLLLSLVVIVVCFVLTVFIKIILVTTIPLALYLSLNYLIAKWVLKGDKKK